jgi:DNA-binding transcriptional regulator YiaG
VRLSAVFITARCQRGENNLQLPVVIKTGLRYRNAIGEGIDFSQSKFANLIGVNIRTLQNWEQYHRHPTGPAKVLLKLVQADPKSVVKNLHGNQA